MLNPERVCNNDINAVHLHFEICAYYHKLTKPYHVAPKYIGVSHSATIFSEPHLHPRLQLQFLSKTTLACLAPPRNQVQHKLIYFTRNTSWLYSDQSLVAVMYIEELGFHVLIHERILECKVRSEETFEIPADANDCALVGLDTLLLPSSFTHDVKCSWLKVILKL